MKVIGIILIVLGGLNFIFCLIGLASNATHAERLGGQLITDIGLIGLGIYLVNRANTKKKEEEEKNNWANKE